jgi:hypothetical protein
MLLKEFSAADVNTTGLRMWLYISDVYISIKCKIQYKIYGQELVYSVLNEVFLEWLLLLKQKE